MSQVPQFPVRFHPQILEDDRHLLLHPVYSRLFLPYWTEALRWQIREVLSLFVHLPPLLCPFQMLAPLDTEKQDDVSLRNTNIRYMIFLISIIRVYIKTSTNL